MPFSLTSNDKAVLNAQGQAFRTDDEQEARELGQYVSHFRGSTVSVWDTERNKCIAKFEPRHLRQARRNAAAIKAMAKDVNLRHKHKKMLKEMA